MLMRQIMRSVIPLLVLSLAACSASSTAPVATVAYDGTYNGDMDKMLSGDPNICSGTAHKSLKVVNGVATIVGETDTRTGHVTPDGKLSMTGSLGTPPRVVSASVIGQFADTNFHGTSKVGNSIICTYEWTLRKS